MHVLSSHNLLLKAPSREQTRNAIILLLAFTATLLFLLIPFDAIAQLVPPPPDGSTGGTAGPAPWEDGLCRIAKSISGPIPKYAAVICVAVMGMLMAFGELGGIFKTMAVVVIGISMAIGAIAWIPWLTGNAVTLAC